MSIKVNSGAFWFTRSAGGRLDSKSTTGSEVLHAKSAMSNHFRYDERGRLWISNALETVLT